MSNYIRAGSVLVSCLTAMSMAYGGDDLRQCAAIEDDASRLACYDRSIGGQTTADEAIAPESPLAEPHEPVAEQKEPVADTSSVEAKSPAAEAAPATTEAAPPVATGSAAAKDIGENETKMFGLPPVPAADGSGTGEITAVVTDITRRPLGEHVIVLDNGQVWEQQAKSSYFPVKPSDSVTIRKRRFGGYLLITPSGRGYGVKRVR